ncbi:hypothetical protein QVD17_37894 [Tagetes erecta]|uniref:Uncharacterized protein n=1 Tax=Tagetes erecta TaxID=13708 RepID=A0AAD8NK84_TARER|nr:hypothetical protein QVD17_37894 [Tagetes erecta]
MIQQHTNKLLIKDLHVIEAFFRIKVGEATTPLYSRTLTFSSTESLGTHDEDIDPMQGSAAGPTTVVRVSTSKDSGFPLGSLFENMRSSIDFNNDANTNNHVDLMLDTCINLIMAKELHELKDMITSVTGVVKPIPEVLRCRGSVNDEKGSSGESLENWRLLEKKKTKTFWNFHSI